MWALILVTTSLSARAHVSDNPVPFSDNPPLICNTAINVSLSASCEASPALTAYLIEDNFSIHTIVEVDRVLPFGNGPWTAAAFSAPDAGRTYQFRVRDTLDGASCTGNITLQDVTPPVLHCADHVGVYVLEKSNLSPHYLQDSLGFSNMFSTAVDACTGVVQVTYKDSLTKFPCDTPYYRIFFRTWKAVDNYGNAGTCKQEIRLLTLSLDQVIFPEDTTASCGTPDGTLPENTGYAHIAEYGHQYPWNLAWNNVAIAHSDSLSSDCNTFIYRKWFALDWCTAQTLEYVQEIDISGAGPTILNCPEAPVVYFDSTDCSIQLPDFQLIQPCSGIVSASIRWEHAGVSDTLVLDSLPNIYGYGEPLKITPVPLAGFPAGVSQLWYEVADACGNSAACSFTLVATDSTGACGASSITCRARTVTMLPIEGVEAKLLVPAVSLDVTKPTDDAGIATFGLFPGGIPFQASCYKNNLFLHGVSTYDLILISRHILGLQMLDSPYKLIAADASGNGVISVFDIATIRSLILGITEEYPENTSWRFVPSDYVFPDPANPFEPAFPEIGHFTAPVSDTLDFTGIKIGDVDNSVIPFNAPVLEMRAPRTLFFETENKQLEAGAEYEVYFGSREMAEGFQFTLQTEGLEILEVLPGAGMSREQFGWSAGQSVLTVACETAGQLRFGLRVKSLRAGELRDRLQINSRITQAEAYLIGEATTIERAAVALGFFTDANEMVLYQNRPNPVASYTDIPFYLPSEMETVLTVFDQTGRILYSKSGVYKKGDQVIRVNLNPGAPGVLYYQLQAGSHCAIRKMVRL